MNKEQWKQTYRYLRTNNLIYNGVVKKFFTHHHESDLRATTERLRYGQRYSKMLHKRINKRVSNDKMLARHYDKRKIKLYKDDTIDDRNDRLITS